MNLCFSANSAVEKAVEFGPFGKDIVGFSTKLCWLFDKKNFWGLERAFWGI